MVVGVWILDCLCPVPMSGLTGDGLYNEIGGRDPYANHH